MEKKITKKELEKIWKLIFDKKQLGIKIRWIPSKCNGIPRQYFTAPLIDCRVAKVFRKKDVKQNNNYFKFGINDLIILLQRKIKQDIKKNKWHSEIIVFVSEQLVLANANKYMWGKCNIDSVILFGIAKYWGK